MALQSSPGWAAVCQLREWMLKPCQFVSLRVNTLRISPEEALKKTQHSLERSASLYGRPPPVAFIHPSLKEVIAIPAWPNSKPLLQPLPDKTDLPVVVIDAPCAYAVLKGSPIFKGGILAISDNISVNSPIRIDVYREGHRGWVGYGVVRSVPEKWERECCDNTKVPYDIVAEMTEGLSVLPPVPRELIANGFGVRQSLPSIITSHVLHPQPGERILDFGCGTGCMTTHIAALTSNKAEVIAVDSSRSRINTLISRCELLGAKVTPINSDVKTFACKEAVGFDRILVHPDHSFFGARPCIPSLSSYGRSINIHIREYIEVAVNLLKPGGTLVYCTGSLVPLETDGVVRWLLDRRRDLKLKPAEPRLVNSVKNVLHTPSWMRLTPDEEKLIQRFGPGISELATDPVNADVPGFFIACLKKEG